MERIELKFSLKPWITFFVLFFTFATAFLVYFAQNQSLGLLLTLTFSASLAVVGSAFGILYTTQKEIILTDTEITAVGRTPTSIPYSEIEKIKVGASGFSIYPKGKSPINITTMYSNFAAAQKLLNAKINDYKGIEITGINTFVNKYINQK